MKNCLNANYKKEERIMKNGMTSCLQGVQGEPNATSAESPENLEKHCAVWTSYATSMLLKLYESKLSLLETPKKKRRIWMAISDDLKEYNVEMTPDQVRWKVNALTKKYKKCLDSNSHDKFKYFKEMNRIYSLYNVDSDAYFISELLDNIVNKRNRKRLTNSRKVESKRIIELRKIRLASRIEADRSQSNLNLERQWLDYLQKQEYFRKQQDEIMNKCLDIREEKLQLRKKELDMKQSLEFKKIQLEEKDLDEMLQIENEKCDILKQIFTYEY